MVAPVTGGSQPSVQPVQPAQGNSPAASAVQPADPARIISELRASSADGVLDQQDFGQLRTQIGQQLYGASTQVSALNAEQLQRVDTLIADALDGQIDSRNALSNATDVIQALARPEAARFSPVGFAIPEPGAGQLAVQFSSEQLVDKLLQSSEAGKRELGRSMLGELASGFAQAPPEQQRETLTALLRNGSAEQKRELGRQLTSQPELLNRLIDTLTTANLDSPASAAISALIMNADQPEAVAKLSKVMQGMQNADQIIPFYENAATAIKAFGLDNSPRKTADHPSFGVGRKLAEAHFQGLSAQTQFSILMKVRDPDGNDLLRPLIRSLDSQPAKKEEIRRLAQQAVSDYATSQRGAVYIPVNEDPGLASVAGAITAAAARVTPQDRERAMLILKILDEPGDETITTPQTPQTPSANPLPAQNQPARPPVTVEQPAPQPVTPVRPPTQAADAPVVEEVAPAPENVPTPDFSTQTYLERMRRFREDGSSDKLLEGLSENDQIKLVRLLDESADGRFRKPPGTSDTLPEPSREQAKAALEAVMPGIQTLSPAARGQVAARLLADGTRPDLAMSLFRQARSEGQLPEVMTNLRVDGQDMSAEIPERMSNEDAGKVLAWMVTSESGSRENADQISRTVNELSRYITEDDNITRAFVSELQDHLSRPGNSDKTLALIKDHMGQNLVSKLTENLDRGWVTAKDREFFLKLSAAAGTQMSNPQLQQMLRANDTRTAMEIMQRASTADLAGMLNSSDSAQLNRAFSADPGGFAKLLGRLEREGSSLSAGDRAAVQTRVNESIAGMQLPHLRQAWHALNQAGPLQLGDRTREALLARFADSGDFATAKTLVRGGSGLTEATGESRTRMLDSLAASVTRVGNVNQAGEALSWILEYGSKAQIERAFQTVSTDSRIGNRKGEIVNAAMTQGRDRLRGKLSLDTLQFMAGSLNNFSSKVGASSPQFVRDWLSLGDFNKNVQNIRALADLGGRDAKAAIMRDLMDYWTPAQSETLIHDILNDSTRTGDFRSLIDAVGSSSQTGPQRTAAELESRAELGRIMASTVENYGPGVDKAIQDMMSQTAYLKADDVIHHMLKRLEPGAAGKLAQKLSAETLNALIGYNTPIRDGNVMNLDPESQWSVDILRAALQQKTR